MLPYRVPRRRFLQTAFAVAASQTMGTWAQAGGSRHTWVLLGPVTGKGIFRARWDGVTGELGTPELAGASPQPTFLASHPHLPVVYAANEGDGEAAAVSAFTVDRFQGTLTPLAQSRTQGNAPCFLSVDRRGRLLFTANYGGGSLSGFHLDAAGKPSSAAAVFACAGNALCGTPGPRADRQDASHFHCAVVSPENCFLLVCDLGEDDLLVFPLTPDTARPFADPIRVPMRAGSGPRHLAFHPNGRWLYCIHELDCTVDLYRWRVHRGRAELTPVPDSVTSVLPAASGAPAASRAPTASGAAPLAPGELSTGAELAISRDGRFLYTSTRGADVLTGFSIDSATGRLTRLQQLACGGRTPRFFAFDPSERWLLCAHQNGNSITTFARDERSGELTQRSTRDVTNPQCLLWV